MKLSDLESGMVVETKDKIRYLVVGNIFLGNNGFNRKSEYTENLKAIRFENFDIVKVYCSINALTIINSK